MNGQKLEEVTSFKPTWEQVLLGSTNLDQDCRSDGSSGQIKQDLPEQHHQLHEQVQVVQVSCHFHPPLRL